MTVLDGAGGMAGAFAGVPLGDPSRAAAIVCISLLKIGPLLIYARGTNADPRGWGRSNLKDDPRHAPYTRRALHRRLRLDRMGSDPTRTKATKRLSAQH